MLEPVRQKPKTLLGKLLYNNSNHIIENQDKPDKVEIPKGLKDTKVINANKIKSSIDKLKGKKIDTIA